MGQAATGSQYRPANLEIAALSLQFQAPGREVAETIEFNRVKLPRPNFYGRGRSRLLQRHASIPRWKSIRSSPA